MGNTPLLGNLLPSVMTPSQPGTSSSGGPSDLSGRQLGGFRLLRRLGQGAMAQVYLAEQEALGRRVAVKVLRPDLSQDPIYLQRFQREAQAAASLVHANIVQIYEVGQAEGLHFIAQEYVEGQNLRQWFSRHGPPDLPHALSVMRQAAAALAKAGESGIVHRDIKPENIMLTPQGDVKVADFGLARFAREGDSVDLTQTGMTLGTPLYMSPEQIEGRPLDPRSDLYSLGVTCYQMLAGTTPFAAETALAVAMQHLNRQPPWLGDLRPDLPTALCQLVHRMLGKQPEDRPSSAAEVLRELRRLAATHVGETWPEDLPGWDVDAGQTPLSPQVALTRQLDALMKADRSARRWPSFASIVVLLCLIGFSAGGAVAWWFALERPLLAHHNLAVSSVPRYSTALRQWYYASQVGTRDAWRSVVEYSPPNEYLAHRAQQQLARIYLRENDFLAAMRVFKELADLGHGNEEFKAFGLAGVSGLLSLEGRYPESAAVLDQLWPIRSRLRDEQMQEMLHYTVQRNQQKAGAAADPRWRQWLDQQFRATD